MRDTCTTTCTNQSSKIVPMNSPIRSVILQRVIPKYRTSLFTRLCHYPGHNLELIIGTDLPESKAKNAKDLSDIKHKKLQATTISLYGRVLTWHYGLLASLREIKPDVIVCEAESHFLGYITAIVYKILFSSTTKLVLWCFYSLPGRECERTFFHAAVKSITRRFFSHYISYGNFGKNYLVARGIDSNRITVAINVGDTQSFQELDSKLAFTKDEAKSKLGVQGRFVVTYVGTLTEEKRPDVLVELARIFQNDSFAFFLIGDGPAREKLAAYVDRGGLTNLYLPGNVSDKLSLHYRATDALIIPGLGGIVISEAMSFGIPVLVHQADGTEYDLVKQGQTGEILSRDHPADFADAIRRWAACPDNVERMGNEARRLIAEQCNTEEMARAIISAIEMAAEGVAYAENQDTK